MINFSIIIPTFNRPHLAGRAIDSALSNLIEGDEIIVIDDGSNADYVELISKYDSNIVKYHKIINGGVSAARNHGLDLALHNYIAFLDDDDEWYSHHLNLQRKVYSAEKELAGIFCNFDNTFINGDKLPNGIARWSEGRAQIQDLLNVAAIPEVTDGTLVYIGEHYKNQLTTDYILPSSFSFNKNICGDKDRFLLGLNRNQTWLFNSHICSYGPVAFIDNITCVQHADAEVRNTGISLFKTIDSRLIVMSKVWGSNERFLADNKELYDETRFLDFFQGFKVAVRGLSIKQIFRLIELVGFKDFVRYSLQSILYFFKRNKASVRTA